MVLLPALLLSPAVPQRDRTETLGLSYAQILALGETKWTARYAKARGSSTPAIAGGFITYGDALAWRNDRLLKEKAFPLRKHLTDFSAELQGVGNTLTDGGTIWTIFAGQAYRNVEETLYRVLTHSGKAPGRVVSDVAGTLTAFAPPITRITDPQRRKRAQAGIASARADFRAIVADARRLSRRDSNTVLEFCRTTARNVLAQATEAE